MKELLQMVLWTHLGVAPTTTPPVNRPWELKSLHGVPPRIPFHRVASVLGRFGSTGMVSCSAKRRPTCLHC
jgi:hypothetical protein